MSVKSYVKEPSFESFLHSRYSVVDTQVKYVDSDNDTMFDARDYQREAVLELHMERKAALKFQESILRFQEECREWDQKGFVVPKVRRTYVPLKKSIAFPEKGITFNLQIDKQVEGEVEHADDYSSQWFFRKSFYTMIREDKSTATLLVIEKLEKK